MCLILSFYSMGFMELKRQNAKLATEVQSLHEKSELREMEHREAINQLAQEIAMHKVGQKKKN